ncbi:lipoate--protein ligase family protein [Alkalicoccus luteus]|uniref:Lipoate--protein ligase family protein n=1 Tax=Alkalicoccus luteus TaxID=1237094 RepID=A0A969PNU4_9BACI|nr:biotin/lipoate A/B protein ligase family protein [Alkalicoccus luteus]NJP37647.1 lipoate--protein ligase family protein [Alkalicoccus luteus]
MEQWYYINSGAAGPAYNMALDEKLMDWHREGHIPPVIRFYEWDPASLSLGYFQRVDRDIDTEAVKHHGAGLVRRPTGGRAVLHEDELTYSIIVKEDHPGIPAGITEAYRVLSGGLLLGFKNMGLEAGFSIPRTEEEKADLKSPRSAVCFDAPSWYEMVVNGRKIAGSAQTRQKGVILQHGSIIRSFDEEKLFDMFLFKSEKIRRRMQAGFRSKATPMEELMDHVPSAAEMRAAFVRGFEEDLNIQLTEWKLSMAQEDQVRKLAADKYAADEWNYKY